METEKIGNKGLLSYLNDEHWQLRVPPFDPNKTLREMIDDVLRRQPTAHKMPKRVPKRKK